MTIKDLEAKCRDKIESHQNFIATSPNLILQLIDERRLLAMVAADTPQFYNPLHAMAAKQLRDRVLQEIAECKS